MILPYLLHCNANEAVFLLEARIQLNLRKAVVKKSQPLSQLFTPDGGKLRVKHVDTIRTTKIENIPRIFQLEHAKSEAKSLAVKKKILYCLSQKLAPGQFGGVARQTLSDITI